MDRKPNKSRIQRQDSQRATNSKNGKPASLGPRRKLRVATRQPNVLHGDSRRGRAEPRKRKFSLSAIIGKGGLIEKQLDRSRSAAVDDEEGFENENEEINDLHDRLHKALLAERSRDNGQWDSDKDHVDELFEYVMAYLLENDEDEEEVVAARSVLITSNIKRPAMPFSVS